MGIEPVRRTSMQEQGRRIRFQLKRLAGDPAIGGAWRDLAGALQEMDRLGCIPAAPDGRTVGNIAMVLNGGLLISRSGRTPGAPGPDDFVTVVRFDAATWTAEYLSARDGCEPSSDTPLHWAALVTIPHALGWSDVPMATIHGHALENEEAAHRLGLPISPVETEFSTPADVDAMTGLMRDFSYPAHRVFIRRGHGFFTLGRTVRDAWEQTRTVLDRARTLRLIP